MVAWVAGAEKVLRIACSPPSRAPCRPEDAQWNPRHPILACTGAYGSDANGLTYGDIELRWKPR